MKQLSLLFHFYKNYVAATGLAVSGLCWFTCYGYGEDAVGFLFFVKLFTDLIVYSQLFITKPRRARVVYYYNLNLSKATLWSFGFMVDLFIFITGACIILKLKAH